VDVLAHPVASWLSRISRCHDDFVGRHQRLTRACLPWAHRPYHTGDMCVCMCVRERCWWRPTKMRIFWAHRPNHTGDMLHDSSIVWSHTGERQRGFDDISQECTSFLSTPPQSHRWFVTWGVHCVVTHQNPLRVVLQCVYIYTYIYLCICIYVPVIICVCVYVCVCVCERERDREALMTSHKSARLF